MDNTTQDFGADMADYPHDTVPNKVKQLFRSQLMHAKNDRVKGKTSVDRLVPIIADGDTGHGGQTANMKLMKLFVEAGCAGVHVDDQVGDSLTSADRRFPGPRSSAQRRRVVSSSRSKSTSRGCSR